MTSSRFFVFFSFSIEPKLYYVWTQLEAGMKLNGNVNGSVRPIYAIGSWAVKDVSQHVGLQRKFSPLTNIRWASAQILLGFSYLRRCVLQNVLSNFKFCSNVLVYFPLQHPSHSIKTTLLLIVNKGRVKCDVRR